MRNIEPQKSFTCERLHVVHTGLFNLNSLKFFTKIVMIKPSILFALLSAQFAIHYVDAGMNKQCMEEMRKMMEKQTKLIVPCIESLGVTTAAEKKEKALCIMKCVMVKGQMLAPDGAVDMDLAQKMLDDLPDALKSKAGEVIGECGHHAAALDPSEASCESYRDFVSCMLDVALKMCNE